MTAGLPAQGRRQQRRILDLAGQVEHFPDYDYKALRRRKRA